MELIASIFTVLLIMSFIIERIVEMTFGTAADKIPVLAPHKWALLYVAMILAVIGTFIYKLDLFYQMGIALKLDIPFSPYGIIGTGIIVGGGSNLINDIWKKFFPKTIPPDISATMNK